MSLIEMLNIRDFDNSLENPVTNLTLPTQQSYNNSNDVEVEPGDVNWNVPSNKLPNRNLKPNPILMTIPNRETQSFNLETILSMLICVIVVIILIWAFIHFFTPYSIFKNPSLFVKI
jgi:hypothetical protein